MRGRILANKRGSKHRSLDAAKEHRLKCSTPSAVLRGCPISGVIVRDVEDGPQTKTMTRTGQTSAIDPSTSAVVIRRPIAAKTHDR